MQDFRPAEDRFGSKSVIRRYPRDVRITPASGPPRVIAIGREDSPCALLLTESNSVVWHELTVAPSRKAGVSVGAVPPSSVPEISRFYDFFIHRDLSRCKLSFANR